MASIDVTATSSASPKDAWALASDLSRFDEWLTIFGGWRSRLPEKLQKGTRVSSLIKVKGFRNVIHWEVTEYDEPNRIELRGKGRGGVHICLDLRVREKSSGSLFHVVATLSGGLLNGPVGRVVAGVLKSDVRKSVAALAALSPTPSAS
ncbi:polyketide cyclase / dehydrase and lipid transport [Mycobacterium sp. GA-1841]|uniref:type II toxin-antitoxin system Rv0910 family toxin n=1 Tax=Mycobacterium sp. GA-1841 TaxID=1834154 RepID=UPI00096E6281|nr:SRPBCC family protein [Mycobacterium sp. GA-1841]OMC29970.1 polyketide cyclase / dehydrase and lipid transport [Mycobacterium sp. GA-1841]